MKTFEFDFSEFEAFAKRFGSANTAKASDYFLRQSIQGIGQYVRDKAVQYSPTGDYGGAVNYRTRRGRNVSFMASSRTGGLLKRSWHLKDLTRKGNGYEITLENNASVMQIPEHPLAKNRGLYFYAESVNYGHIATTLDRLPHVKNIRPVKETPVEGQYMLERALGDADEYYVPKELRERYTQFLSRFMGDD